jgi:hypothetical protein
MTSRTNTIAAMLMTLLFCTTMTGQERQAFAFSSKELDEACLGEFKDWLKQDGFAAFAYSKDGSCGLSWEYESAKEAVDAAIDSCKQEGGVRCRVIAEKRPRAETSAAAAYVAGENCQEDFKTWQSHEGFGAFALAPDGACGYSWEFDTPEEAQTAAFENCAPEPDAPCMIVGEKAVVPSIQSNAQICETALSADKSGWSEEQESAGPLEEAKNRKLTVEDCRKELGLPSAVQAELPATTGKRVALIVGNANYVHENPLRNTLNDAELMAKSLEKAGFSVTVVEDLNLTQLKTAMLKFGRALREGVDASLFYYSGHGIEVGGENYIVPVDAAIDNEREVALQSVNMSDMLQTMEDSAAPVNIIILDACRTNPFGSGRAVSGGLAAISAPKGTFIAYATSPKKIAADGEGNNSPFTAALAEEMLKPGLKLEDVFKLTRARVLETTGNAQLPWDTSSLVGDFYFVPGD